MTAKQVRFVTNDEPFDNQNVAELAAFDAAGKPVTITGGVKKATAVADLASAADTAAIIATVNAVLAAFRASGAMAAPTSADQPSEVQSAAIVTPQQ